MPRITRRLTIIFAAALLPSILPAQEWASRYPPAPECALRWTRAEDQVGTGVSVLVVRTILARNDSLYPGSRVRLSPLPVTRPDTQRPTFRDWQGSGIHRFDSVAPGRYRLEVQGLGAGREVDTIEIRPGSADTVTAPMLDHLALFFNDKNCRPHRFRHPGESACVVAGGQVDLSLQHVRSLADTEEIRMLRLRPYTVRQISLVRDERICDRAGRAYDSTSPPRRVIVIRAGPMYYVYDPFEPIHGGEFEFTCFYDRRWRSVACLFG